MEGKSKDGLRKQRPVLDGCCQKTNNLEVEIMTFGVGEGSKLATHLSLVKKQLCHIGKRI